jgi:hypothetical protein
MVKKSREGLEHAKKDKKLKNYSIITKTHNLRKLKNKNIKKNNKKNWRRKLQV